MVKAIDWRKRKRAHALMWAMLVYDMRAQPVGPRTIISWRYLLEWAMLGGKPDEVPGSQESP